MRVGYVANANAVGCKSNRRFRLRSYSEERFLTTVASNLACLEQILRFNAEHGLLSYRITSDLVPFASHPVCRVRWRERFAERLAALGDYIKTQGMRVSMHPGQYTLLNTPDPDVLSRSLAELAYQRHLLDALGLDRSAKIQIHGGGVYCEKAKAIERFCETWRRLDDALTARLAVENDDVRFSLRDCLTISAAVGVPVIFDTLHHECLNNGETRAEALALAAATWSPEDGPPMVDYSSQQPGRRAGRHADSLDADHFRAFLHEAGGGDFDLMLELRDKEASALQALRLLREGSSLGGGR